MANKMKEINPQIREAQQTPSWQYKEKHRDTSYSQKARNKEKNLKTNTAVEVIDNFSKEMMKSTKQQNDISKVMKESNC